MITVETNEAVMPNPTSATVEGGYLCVHDAKKSGLFFRMGTHAAASAAALALNIAIRGSDEQVAALTAALAAIPGAEAL